MFKFKTFALALVAAAFLAAPAVAAPVIGEKAPAFTAVDSNGKEHSLSDYVGKIVVLEWTNHECPFVRKHYNAGNIPALQKKAAEDGIVWLTIISSAPGTQGHVDGDTANKLTAEREAAPAAVLLDESGTIGRAYDAKTTPHMYVIDKEGTLVYAGAIDSIPSVAESDIEKATNYVTAALESVKAGKPVAIAATKAYGCNVKYE